MSWVFFSDPQAFIRENSQEAKLGKRLIVPREVPKSSPHPLILNVEALFQHLGTWYTIHGWFPTAIRFERFGPLKNPMFFKGANLQFFGFRADKRLGPSMACHPFFSAPSFCWGMIFGHKIIRFQLEVRLNGFWDSDRGFKRFGNWTFLNDVFFFVTFFVNALLQKGPNLRYQIAIEKGNQLNGTK